MPLCPGDLAARLIRLGICVAVVWLPKNKSYGFADAQSYRIRSWKAEDGLPQNSVTSILQARDRYLWLGTFNGLARFDGVQFTVQVPENTAGLPSNRILALFEDHDGALVIGTEEGHLARSTRVGYTSLLPNGRPQPSAALRAIAQSRDGAYWLLTFDWQLMKWSSNELAVVSTNWNLSGSHVFGL